LIEKNLADAGILQQIESSVGAEVQGAVEYALNAPFPVAEEVNKHVYA